MKYKLGDLTVTNWNDWDRVPRMPQAVATYVISALGATGFTAAAITAVSYLAVSAVTSWAISALSPKPDFSSFGSQGTLVNARDAAAPAEFVYGEVRKGGIVTFYESTGEKNKYLHQIIVLAAHEVEAIDDIYINDEIVTVEDATPVYTISVDQTVQQGGEGDSFTETATYTLTIPSAYDIHTTGDSLSEAEFDVLVDNATSNTNDSSFGNITFNSASVTSTSSNTGLVTGDTWKSKIRVQKYLGNQTTAPADLLAESELTGDDALDANFVGNGIAYLYVRYEYDQNVFANGIPLVTAKLRGKKVYDPRDQTTAYSNNPALCIRDYISSVYGLNDTAIDDVYFAAAANESDESVSLEGGGTEPRYTMNGIVRAARSTGSVLGDMVTSCAGTLFWGSGYWKLKVGVYSAPVKTLTLDDLRGPINLETRISMRDNFNAVRGTFNDAAQGYITADYPEIVSAAFKTEDGEEEVALDLPLPFTTSAASAQRLAKLTLFRGREQMTINADFGLEAFSVEVGDIIEFDNPRYGFDGKEFEVVGWRFSSNQEAGDLRVNLTLRETSAAAFDWNAEETAIISNNTTLPVYNAGTDILGLTASGGGRLQGDGTFINSVFVAWTPAQNSYLSHYEVEWKAVVDGSYSSTTTPDPIIELSPLVDGVEYVIRVRAVTISGFRGAFSSVLFTGGGDVTAPSDPTSFSATGTLGFIDLSWVNPADTDLNYVEVWESADSNIANATQIAKAFGDTFNRGNLSPLVTRYYWIRAVDFSGNKSGFVGPEFATTSQITAGDIGPAVIQYDNFATDVTALFDDISTDLSERVLLSDYNITVDYQQQLEAATDQLATDALTLALNASSLESRINDAGITVDPTSGSVTIQGLSAVEDRVNEVEIDLDAVEGELTLKATTSYVNNAIAAATLPEASLAALEDLEARVDTVEVDLNSVEGSITLTSSGSLYDVNDGVLGVEALEGRITVNEGEITLKASQTELDDVETRLGSAEVTLNSIDAPSIALSVQDVRSISEKQGDLAELTLQEVLGRYKDREYLLQDSSSARLSLTADVNEEREARAAAELELSAKIDENRAFLLSEQVVRADADSALAGQVTSLSTTVGDNTTTITEAAASINGIEAKYGVEIDNNGSITGYQLLSGEGGSAFNVRADQFAVFDASGAGGVPPFTVFTSSRTVDGVVYPAGTYIKDAYIDTAAIVNGSITNAMIKNAAISSAKIDDAAITTAKIDDLQVDTLKIKNQAVSNTAADSSGLTSITTVDEVDGYTTVATVALSTGGGQTIVNAAGQFSFGGVGQGSSHDGAWRILKGAAVLASGSVTGGSNIEADFAGLALTTSTSGTTTINLQCTKTRTGGDNDLDVSATLVLTELKK